MSHYSSNKFDDDRNKRNKTRSESVKHTDKRDSTTSHHSSHHRAKQHRDDDDYYTSKRSRSRSRSNTRTPQPQQKTQRVQKYEEPTVMPSTPAGFSNNMISKAFNPGNPSRTIMLRQLPLQMEDHELRNELVLMSVNVKDVRLVKNRDTGQSRGFAFIEFNTLEEAQNWMNLTLGWVIFSSYGNRVQLFYSHSSEESNSFRSDKMSSSTDWDCAKCGIKNFKRRDRCFKCSITREESERRSGGDGYDHVGATPCNTLLLRGLDALTNEQTVLNVLNQITNSCILIKNCHIARDVLTNVSCGFAFIELTSIQDSATLLQLIQPNFEVDGKQVTASFSKNSYKTALTQLEIASRLSYQPLASSDSNYNSYTNNKTNQTDQANSAASIAQAAMANMHKKQELLNHYTNHMKQQMAVAGTDELDSTVSSNLQLLANQAKYSAPDMSTFTYDETSGYYYDYTTGFYYDATSQYYFNPLTQQYMYWDQIKSTYIPATNHLTQQQPEQQQQPEPVQETEPVITTTAPIEQPEIVKPTKPAVKTAAQIAKDMERWAQSQNKKKEVTVKQKPMVTTVTTQPKVFEPVKQVIKEVEPQQPVHQLITEEKKVLIKQPIEDLKVVESIDSEHEEVKMEPVGETSLIDTNKMACLLCKRRFDSLEILNKHIAKSDLHKKNLELYKKEHQIVEQPKISSAHSDSDSLLAALQYRDRAKERRQKYGTPEPPSPTYSTPTPVATTAHKAKPEIDEPIEKNSGESVASKLMKKMGWNEGSGIGKNLQGISAPIEATMRQKGAGLGAASYEMDPNDSYKDAARKSARARFESLN